MRVQKGKGLVYLDEDINFHLAGLSDAELDALPFGVIKVDPQGVILSYNLAEQEISGRDRAKMIGRNFFEIAPCTVTPEFKGLFDTGIRLGKMDFTFKYIFDFKMRPTAVTIRLKQSMTNGAPDGNILILVEMIERKPDNDLNWQPLRRT